MENREVIHLFLCQNCDNHDYLEKACVSAYTCPHCQGVARIIRLNLGRSKWGQEVMPQGGVDEWSDDDIERYLGLR